MSITKYEEDYVKLQGLAQQSLIAQCMGKCLPQNPAFIESKHQNHDANNNDFNIARKKWNSQEKISLKPKNKNIPLKNNQRMHLSTEFHNSYGVQFLNSHISQYCNSYLNFQPQMNMRMLGNIPNMQQPRSIYNQKWPKVQFIIGQNRWNGNEREKIMGYQNNFGQQPIRLQPQKIVYSMRETNPIQQMKTIHSLPTMQFLQAQHRQNAEEVNLIKKNIQQKQIKRQISKKQQLKQNTKKHQIKKQTKQNNYKQKQIQKKQQIYTQLNEQRKQKQKNNQELKKQTKLIQMKQQYQNKIKGKQQNRKKKVQQIVEESHSGDTQQKEKYKVSSNEQSQWQQKERYKVIAQYYMHYYNHYQNEQTFTNNIVDMKSNLMQSCPLTIQNGRLINQNGGLTQNDIKKQNRQYKELLKKFKIQLHSYQNSNSIRNTII